MIKNLKYSYFSFVFVLILLYGCSKDSFYENPDLEQTVNLYKSQTHTGEVLGYSFHYSEIDSTHVKYEGWNDMMLQYNANSPVEYNYQFLDQIVHQIDFDNSTLDFYVLPVHDQFMTQLGYTTEANFVEMYVEDDVSGVNNSVVLVLQQHIKGDIIINEVWSPLSGKLLSYDLEGIGLSDYLILRPGSFDPSTLEPNSDEYHCFTTLKACTQHMAPRTTLDQVACEWIPCNTIAYAACTFMEINGDIETSDNFNCSKCDVLVGEE